MKCKIRVFSDDIFKRGLFNWSLYVVRGVVSATHWRVYWLLYFVKSKYGTKCKNFVILLCFMSIHSFFEMAERGGYSPPKFATGMGIIIIML